MKDTRLWEYFLWFQFSRGQNVLILPTRLSGLPGCSAPPAPTPPPARPALWLCYFLVDPSCATPLWKPSGFSLSPTLETRALLLDPVTRTLDPHLGPDCPDSVPDLLSFWLTPVQLTPKVKSSPHGCSVLAVAAHHSWPLVSSRLSRAFRKLSLEGSFLNGSLDSNLHVPDF